MKVDTHIHSLYSDGIYTIEEILDINLDDIGDKSKIYLSLMIRYLL